MSNELKASYVVRFTRYAQNHFMSSSVQQRILATVISTVLEVS